MRHLSTAYGTVHRQGLTGVETTLIAVLSLPTGEGDMCLARTGSTTAHAAAVRCRVGLVPAKEKDFGPRARRIDPVQLEEFGERGRGDIGGRATVHRRLLGKDIGGRGRDADDDCYRGATGLCEEGVSIERCLSRQVGHTGGRGGDNARGS